MMLGMFTFDISQNGFDMFAGPQAIDLEIKTVTSIVTLSQRTDLDPVGPAALSGFGNKCAEHRNPFFQRPNRNRLNFGPSPATFNLILIRGLPTRRKRLPAGLLPSLRLLDFLRHLLLRGATQRMSRRAAPSP